MQLRFDKAQAITGTVRTDEGYLEVTAPVGRTGILLYRTTDGGTIREYVPESTLFNQDSMNSLKLKPVTNLHPEEMVDPTSFRELAVGTVGETITREGNLLLAKFIIADLDTIEEIESGNIQELSLGYFATTEDRTGVSPEGETYDSVQLSRKYNHLALVNSARGGSILKIKLDGSDGIILKDNNETNKPEVRMSGKKTTLRIDGLDHEIENEAVAKHIATLTGKCDSLDAELVTAKNEAVTLKAKADSLEDEVAKLKAIDHEKIIASRVDSRIELLTKAEKILGEELKRDASDLEIKKAVILKVQPNAKMDAGDLDEKQFAIYIDARADSCFEILANDETALQRLAVHGDRKDSSDPKDTRTLEQKRKDSLESRWEGK